MIKQLHPTLKKCRCHYIGTKTELYKHFDQVRRRMKQFNEPAREFFAGHGEVPLNVDDPRLDLVTQIKKSLICPWCKDIPLHFEEGAAYCEQCTGLFYDETVIPSGHRLDDNNTLIPRI